MSRVSAPWSARAKPQAWRSMWGWAEKGRAAALLHAFTIRLTVERCKGLRCSLTKNVLPVGSIRARCLSHAPMAFNSSPRKGWVVENPRFNRTMCKTLPFGVHLFELQPAGLGHAQPMPKNQQQKATIAGLVATAPGRRH